MHHRGLLPSRNRTRTPWVRPMPRAARPPVLIALLAASLAVVLVGSTALAAAPWVPGTALTPTTCPR
jgi:hypothetical protein